VLVHSRSEETHASGYRNAKVQNVFFFVLAIVETDDLDVLRSIGVFSILDEIDSNVRSLQISSGLIEVCE
jgi:hypothetical protein